MRTERNWSPRKIWLNGVINPASRGLIAIRDICESIPHDDENFGVDEEGPLPLHEDIDGVEVPVTPVPVTDLQLQQLKSFIEHDHDDSGVSTFLRAQDLFNTM